MTTFAGAGDQPSLWSSRASGHDSAQLASIETVSQPVSTQAEAFAPSNLELVR
ncbi:MAG TPA: hypothetical protein VGL55_07840 [Steroidobacteraceae bacterium]|jgi:hypothetical protein